MLLLLQGLNLFSQTSGLFPNPAKCAIFFAGVQPEEKKKRILQVSWFAKGRLLLNYLGVPIYAKRLPVSEGEKLV